MAKNVSKKKVSKKNEEVKATEATVITEFDAVEAAIAKLEEEIEIEAEVTTTPDGTATDKVDARINILISVLPAKVTPKDLCQLFNFDDGGKTIRRHLRSKFTEPSNHEHKEKWEWGKKDKVLRAILAYFQDKYDSFPEKMKAAK